MIKTHWKLLIFTSILILLPMLAGIIIWDMLPQQIPSHWNVAGEVDQWSDKAFVVFGFPLILLAAQWLCSLGTSADPKKANHSGKVLNIVLWVIPAISILLLTITYLTALGMDIRIEVIMPLFFGFVFTIIGNYMPKCKQNYTVGIKIPWTLNSEENWNRTHRFAGRLWLVCGIIIMLTVFFGGFVIFVGITLIMVLAPIIYSYTLHRKGI